MLAAIRAGEKSLETLWKGLFHFLQHGKGTKSKVPKFWIYRYTNCPLLLLHPKPWHDMETPKSFLATTAAETPQKSTLVWESRQFLWGKDGKRKKPFKTNFAWGTHVSPQKNLFCVGTVFPNDYPFLLVSSFALLSSFSCIKRGCKKTAANFAFLPKLFLSHSKFYATLFHWTKYSN